MLCLLTCCCCCCCNASTVFAGASGRKNTSDSGGAEALPKHDLVAQFLSTANMSQRERLKAEKQQLIKSFQRHAADVASPEVTGAVMMQPLQQRLRHCTSSAVTFVGWLQPCVIVSCLGRPTAFSVW
jgi:hypothetical protein